MLAYGADLLVAMSAVAQLQCMPLAQKPARQLAWHHVFLAAVEPVPTLLSLTCRCRSMSWNTLFKGQHFCRRMVPAHCRYTGPAQSTRPAQQPVLGLMCCGAGATAPVHW